MELGVELELDNSSFINRLQFTVLSLLIPSTKDKLNKCNQYIMVKIKDSNMEKLYALFSHFPGPIMMYENFSANQKENFIIFKNPS